MSNNLVYIKNFSPPEIDRREILRYAGVNEATSQVQELLDECIVEAEKLLTYNVCYSVYDIEVCEGSAKLGFACVSSHSLIKVLSAGNCNKAVAFCATVGSGIDRLIAKYNVISPARAVFMQALGSERVEALCEVFCSYVKEELSGTHTKRFSPGYGDLPLDLQREIFDSLECTKRLGVTLNDSLFMIPTKSVTAIIGVKM
ncbi:MAG: Vitamin B12 dependent methionine synthase activation subunit [Clostridia bacterium]|nr:Vitamin B12 dependent methionine synthase activation subunit [Clostridia bacterium]